MNLLNFSLIKIALVFGAGCLLGFYIDLSPSFILSICITLLALFFFAYRREKRMIFPDNLFGSLALLLLFCLGILNSSLRLPENRSDHYLNFSAENEPENWLLSGEISENLKPTNFSRRYILNSEKLIWGDSRIQVEGKILLNLPADSLAHFQPGDRLLLPFETNEFKSPGNPFQFDYRNYMHRQEVYRQIQLQPEAILKTGHNRWSLKALAARFRSKVISKLQQENFGDDEFAVMQALLLGQRQDLSTQTYAAYAAAGAVHILAVSGLHVGIILLLLNHLFRFLNHSPRGRIIKTILLLTSLWAFAIIAGLSPSVTRAVSMFSFVAIGMQLNRKTSVMNSLFTSFFFLILFSPFLIFQVGFQLSYLAVFAIVSIQPKLAGIFKPKTRIIKYFWDIFTVSLAAQIGVLPLSLYYFHQFPGLFLVSNLVVLPLLAIILAGGILLIFLSLLGMVPAIFSSFYNEILSRLNAFINWVANREDFIFSEIHFSIWQVLLAYLCILSLIFYLYGRRYSQLVALLVCIIGLQLIFISEKTSFRSADALVFHLNRNSLITEFKNGKIRAFTTQDSVARQSLSNYKTGVNANSLEVNKLQNFYRFGNKNLLVVDSTEHLIPDFKPDIILLTQSPKINLERLLQIYQPEILVADGSNYNSFVKNWKATAQKQKVPFHHTGEKGTFRIFREP